MPSPSNLRANIAKAYAIRLLFWMHFVASVMVPFYIAWGGLRFSQILFLNAWFMLCMSVFEVPTGTLADRFGRKRSMLLGCLVAVAGVLLYVSRPSFYVFIAAETVLAAGYTLVSGAEEALVYDSLTALGLSGQSKTVFSRMESFKLAGIIIGALLGGVMAKFLGLRAPMLLHTVPLTLAGLVVLSLQEPWQHEPWQRPPWLASAREGWRQFVRDQALRVLVLDMLVVGSLAWLIIWFYQALLKNAGVDVVWFGPVHALMCLGQIAVLETIPRWEQWLGGKRRLLIAMPVAAGLCFILLGLTTRVWPVVLGIVACATFGLIRGPLFMSTLNKFIPSERRATTLSLVSMLRTLGIFVINLSAGWLADWSVPHTMVILGSAMIAMAMFSRIREEHLLE